MLFSVKPLNFFLIGRDEPASEGFKMAQSMILESWYNNTNINNAHCTQSVFSICNTQLDETSLYSPKIKSDDLELFFLYFSKNSHFFSCLFQLIWNLKLCFLIKLGSPETLKFDATLLLQVCSSKTQMFPAGFVCLKKNKQPNQTKLFILSSNLTAVEIFQVKINWTLST